MVSTLNSASLRQNNHQREISLFLHLWTREKHPDPAWEEIIAKLNIHELPTL